MNSMNFYVVSIERSLRGARKTQEFDALVQTRYIFMRCIRPVKDGEPLNLTHRAMP